MESNHFEAAVWSAYALIVIVILFIVWKTVQKWGSSPSSRPGSKIYAEPVRTESKAPGLESAIMKEGSGPKAKKGDLLTVHYRAYLSSGKEVDSSYERGTPMSFKLGARKVIDGWEVALVGAQAGETRKVTVPSKMAYGRKGSPSGKVPPGSDVIFEIDLLKIDR